jgi:predicted enzyme related to lactoylglutathione lyase
MPVNLRHFAIECDDVERAKRFYERVFGWSIRPWGPPNFYQIFSGTKADPGVFGALQERREPLSGTGNRCCECTFGVESLARAIQAIEAHGGRVLTKEFRIEDVGNVIYFADTEGNRIGVMQYDPGWIWPEGVAGRAG